MAQLTELLNLPPQSLISLVGAGGKTTTMYTLASELAWEGRRVITTTTTNIYFPGPGETDTLIVSAEASRLLKMVSDAWAQHRRITVAGKAIGSGKLAGLQPDQPYELLKKGGADVVIVEADGARHHSIKAPAEYEPVVPPQTNVALLLMSATAINRPLDSEIAHRPEHIARVTGIQQGGVLTPEVIARLVTSEQGALKSIPVHAKTYLLITHVTEEHMASVQELAKLVKRSPMIEDIACSGVPGEWLHVI